MVARESFGARLRRLREARGMSRADLANACTGARRQPGPDDIMNYEDGGYMPAVHTFAAIARALRVPMEVLLFGEEEAARIAAERAEPGTYRLMDPAEQAEPNPAVDLGTG